MKDISTLYYIFLAYFTAMIVGEIIREHVDSGRFIDFDMLVWQFYYPWKFFLIWAYMFLWSMLVLLIVPLAVKSPRLVWIPVYTAYQLMTYIVPCLVLWNI
jgi:hypothetical protein